MPHIQISKQHSFKGHNGGIFELQPVNDREFISGGGDGQVVKWNLESLEDGQVIAKVTSTIYGLLVDGSKLLIGENSRGLHLIDITTKAVLRSVEIKAPIFSMLKVKDQYLIGTGAGELFVFDLQLNFTAKIKLSNKSLRSMDANETDISLGYSDHVIRILDKTTLELKYEIKGHKLSVFSTRYHPKTKHLVSTGRDAHIRAWDTFNHYEPIHTIPAHMYACNHLSFAPTGEYFASASMDKTIKIWDGAKFALVKVIDKARHDGHTNSVNKLLWMKFNNLLVSCSDDRTVAVWDIKFD